MSNNKGFTLIELLTVMAILTILMGIAVPRTYHVKDNAAVNVDVNNAKLIKNNMDIYYNVYEKWPDTLDDIFGPGKYFKTLPEIQSRNSNFLIGYGGVVQVVRKDEVLWCSSGGNSTIHINNRLK